MANDGLDKSRNCASGRYGLGLAIAKNIVTNHGGKITASSDNGKTTLRTIFKRNYLLIIAYLIPIIIIAVSFKTYYSEYYSPKQYQEYEKQCELTKNEEICSNKEL